MCVLVVIKVSFYRTFSLLDIILKITLYIVQKLQMKLFFIYALGVFYVICAGLLIAAIKGLRGRGLSRTEGFIKSI